MLNYLKKTYHRNLLEKHLKANAYLIRGKILDIGSKNRRYDHLFKGEIIAADIVPQEGLNIEKQDITRLTYGDSSFDSVICLEVLEYLKLNNLKTALSEISRVLKSGGVAIITVPFYYREHQDNLRLSLGYIAEVLDTVNFKERKIIKFGNRHTALFDIIRFPFSKRIAGNKVKRAIFALYYAPRLALELVFIKGFNLEKVQDDFYSGLFVILTR